MEMESTSKIMKRRHGESGEAKCPKREKNLLTVQSIKQKYNFEAALADLIDNSLQASWCDDTDLRRISIDIKEDSICVIHNGTIIDSSQENASIVEWGRSDSVHKFDEQSMGDNLDLYLRPFFGKFGYGVAVSSMHIGRRAKICSKTKDSGKVHNFDIESDGSLQDSSGAHIILKTDGGMPSTSELEESRKSFRGSFTKVQIFDIHMGSLGLYQLLCRLKDIYFPYIQIHDESSDHGKTLRPVEFQVNGKNLAAEMDGGEVSISNLHACIGEEFELKLQLSSTPEASDGSSSTSRSGNARLRCVYFPIIQGEENIDRIIKKLDASGCGIEGFSCVSVRRLGRLLPNARWARLPFMELKQRTGDEAYRLKRFYCRVKCFIETDAGFIPTPCKTDLLHEDPYTKALKCFGAQLPQNNQGLHVQILKEGKILSLQEMERQYKNWIINMHDKFDEEVVCSDQEAVVVRNIDPSSKELLGITSNVARVCKKVWRKEKYWQSGQRIRILKGASAKFQKTNSYATIEYILVEGAPGATCGEAQFIIRRRDTADDMGCLLLKNSDESYTIDIRNSITLPLRAIDSGKVTDAESSLWNKKIEKQGQGTHISVDSVGMGGKDSARVEINRGLQNENVTIDGQVPVQEAFIPNNAILGQLNRTQVPKNGNDANNIARKPPLYYAKKNYRRIMRKEHKKVCKSGQGSCEEHGPKYLAASVSESFMGWWRFKRFNKKCFAVRTKPKRVVDPNSSRSLPFERARSLGRKPTSLEIFADTHRKAKKDKGLMIPPEAQPIMERYKHICTERGLDPTQKVIKHLVEVVESIRKKNRRCSPITVSEVIPPSEARALQEKDKDKDLSNKSTTTGKTDDLFVKVVERTVGYAREHPNISGPAPNEIRILVQEIIDEESRWSKEQPIRFEMVMDMVRVMCDLFNAIYIRHGTAKDKGKEVVGDTREHSRPSKHLLSPRGGITIRSV